MMQRNIIKYTPKTMNKEETPTRFEEYVAAGATRKLFIGSSFKAPIPTPTPSGKGGGNGNGGSGSSQI